MCVSVQSGQIFQPKGLVSIDCNGSERYKSDVYTNTCHVSKGFASDVQLAYQFYVAQITFSQLRGQLHVISTYYVSIMQLGFSRNRVNLFRWISKYIFTDKLYIRTGGTSLSCTTYCSKVSTVICVHFENITAYHKLFIWSFYNTYPTSFI